MPPRRQHTKKDIEEAAFKIARSKGLAHLSARTIAALLNCSTSPIYSVFSNMREIEDLVCERSVEVMLEYQMKDRTGSPLVDLCLGYVLFAVHEKQLFRDMFLNKVELSEHSKEMKKHALGELVQKMMARDQSLTHLSEKRRFELLSVMWTYSHGLGALLNIGASDQIDEEEITANLDKIITPLVSHYSE